MKKIKQNKSNIILAAILVLLLCLFLIIRYTNSGIAATTQVDIDGTSKGASPKEQTDASKDRTVYEVNEWAGNVTKPGVHDFMNPGTAKPLREQLPGDQVQGDGIYITAADLHSIPSLFCTHKGEHLPGWGNTMVKSGIYQTDITDQGKKTAYLTANDMKIATCFQMDNRLLSGWEASGSHKNNLTATTSETLGKFSLEGIYDCTPVEAYIMASYNTNTAGTIEKLEFTNEEYKGNPPDERDYKNPTTTFIRTLNSITLFAGNKHYTYGDMGEIPTTKESTTHQINNKELIKWGLYSLGYNIDHKNLENSLKSNGWEEAKIEKIERLEAGDIIFLKNASDSDGVIVFSSKNMVYDVSSDSKIQGGQPTARELKIEDIGKVLRVKKDTKVNYRETLADRFGSTNLRFNDIIVYEVYDENRNGVGDERYVAKKDGKFYYVKINDDPEWTSKSDAQNAWWEKSTKSIENGSSGFKHVDLADEAQAFEKYVLDVNNASSVSDLKHNEYGLYNIDYKTSFEPDKDHQDEIKVRFNALENRYIIGPFKADYTRAAIKAGDREKVSFAGISRVVETADLYMMMRNFIRKT